MKRLIVLLIGLAIVGYLAYHYFELDKNKKLQESIREHDISAASLAIETAISTQLASEAKQYLHDHNNYYVSASNNLCTHAQSLFVGLEKFTSNPVECVAHTHSFTARIKEPNGKYVCADTGGFYTTTDADAGYKAGVSCK